MIRGYDLRISSISYNNRSYIEKICIMILKYTRGRNVTKYKYFFFFLKKEIKNYLIK